MKPNDQRLKLDLVAARYLDALEREDFDAMGEIWQLVLTQPELNLVLRQVHAGLIEENNRQAEASMLAAVTAAVETYLSSAEIVCPQPGPVSVAEVAEELFRHAPDRLPAEAHVLNELLRTTTEPLPNELGLPGLISWAEARFGTAPAEYWKVFRQAAVKLELRRAAAAEYHLAARPAPKPEAKP